MHWKYLLFDLDGTLTDPMQGITRSVQYALRHFGIEVEDLTTLCPFIGPPLRDSFREFYGMTSAQADEASEKYGEYFSRQGIFENKLYAGIPELLSALQAQGATLAIATSKPDFLAERIARHFGFRDRFTLICGGTAYGPCSTKAGVIRETLAQLRIDDPSQAVMIPGRRHGVDRRIVGLRQPRRAGKGQSRLPRSRHPGTAANIGVTHRGQAAGRNAGVSPRRSPASVA